MQGHSAGTKNVGHV